MREPQPIGVSERSRPARDPESRIELGAASPLVDRARREHDLLAVCAHELRNPLASLACNLELLRDRLASPALDAQLEMMQWQTRKLERIVEDLLEVSRAGQGKLRLRPERLDLAAVVTRAVESTRHLTAQRRHAVTVTLPGRPPCVLGDAVRLEQVLVNLLVNAAKYTDDGGRIAVTVESVAGEAVIRVSDDGIGMTPEGIARAFDLFAQVAPDSARCADGLGVGLALVRALVALHGGRVAASSAGLGCGSEFVVSLPLAQGAAGEDDPPVVRRVAEPGSAVQVARRVLVVDDSPDVAEAFAGLLEHLGHRVRLACDGPSALVAADEFRPDVAFLDISLPDMDGYAVARELRARGEPPLLVALTGFEHESIRVQAREAGFAKHLMKPAPISQVEALLRDLSAARRPQDG